MASIRKHGDGFQVRYYTDGIQQSEQMRTREAAEIRVKEIDLAKAQGLTVESHPQTIKFWELAKAVVDHYDVNGLRSRDDIECRYRLHLDPFFGMRKAVTITGANINAYVARRKAEGAPNGTINRELEALKRAFRLGIEQETITRMPKIKLLKESNVRTGFFTRAEVDRVCSNLKEPLNRFVLFAFLTAWRYDEIRGLKWSNVDFERGEIRLDPGTTKSGEGRTFPMTAELRGLLLKKPTATPALSKVKGVVLPNMATLTPLVFVVRGRRIGQFRKQWRNACFKAGLPCVVDINGKVIRTKMLFHDLRRSGVRELAKVLGERRAMVRTGHKTRSVFDRYNVTSDFDLTEDRRLLENMATDKATGSGNINER